MLFSENLNFASHLEKVFFSVSFNSHTRHSRMWGEERLVYFVQFVYQC